MPPKDFATFTGSKTKMKNYGDTPSEIFFIIQISNYFATPRELQPHSA